MAHFFFEVHFQNCHGSNDECALLALFSRVLDVLNVFDRCGLVTKKATQNYGPTMYQCIVGIHMVNNTFEKERA